MKSAKQIQEEYRAALDDARSDEELRDLAEVLLHSLVAVKTLLESKKEAEENPIIWLKCSGTGVRTPWIITEDKISEGEQIGTCGGVNISQAQFDLLRDGCLADYTLFRMYDDDGNHYYSGRMIEGKESDGFEPLDDFGSPNAGCTRLDYFDVEKDEWRTL